MALAQMNQESEHQGPSTSDVLICMFGAAAIAFAVWAAVFGVFAGALYGLEYFKLIVPELVTNGLRAAQAIVPVLAAIPAAWFSYKFLIRLP